jgi:hypothetical protein
MLPTTPPASQKNRPISFVLDDRAMKTPIQWVPLVVRPEDLTRTQPSRMSLHQTMGNPGESIGWVDSFGAGLPTVSISGHTGWRQASGQDMDGAAQFQRLQAMVFDVYHLLRQAAVDNGANPADVKLLFVDELDSFSYEVIPMSFVLRRSKSRPLLMQYNIQMQAVSTVPEVPSKSVSGLGDVFSGLGALGGALRNIANFIGKVVSGIRAFIGRAAAVVGKFVGVVVAVCNAVRSVVGSLVNGARGIANDLVGIARSMAVAGRNVFATIAAIASIPAELKHSVQRVGAAFNEVACILANSLGAKGKRYPNYSDVYGASNCSSTTGGRPASVLADTNVFDQMRPLNNPVVMSSAASASLAALERNDPVLAPMSIEEIARNAENVSAGYGGISPSFAASVPSVLA